MKQATDPLAQSRRVVSDALALVKRKVLETSIERVAADLGMSASIVYKWTRAGGSSPSYNTAKRILATLGGRS